MGDQTVKIYKPTINERTVTYRYNNKDITVEFTTKNTGGFSNTRANIGLSIAKAFNEYAFKDKDVNKGNIQRKDAIKILQNVFKENSGTESVFLSSGLKAGYSEVSGLLSETKDFFELYMDKDSDGGETLTQQEQAEILHTYAQKYGKIKE